MKSSSKCRGPLKYESSIDNSTSKLAVGTQLNTNTYEQRYNSRTEVQCIMLL